MPPNKIKIGYINYINSLPLFYNLGCSEIFSVELNSPANLIELFQKEEINIGQMSLYHFLQNKNKYNHLNKFCISAKKTNSVLLITPFKEIQFLNNQEIIITNQSVTSIKLLKILLKQNFNIKNTFSQKEINFIERGNYLLIGDQALHIWQAKLRGDFENYYFFDLAELWYQWTGLPFVFALFVIRKNYYLPPNKLYTLENNLNDNLKNLYILSERSNSENLDKKLIIQYLSLFDYTLSEDAKKSIQEFEQKSKFPE